MEHMEQADWRVGASCRDEDPDGLFVRGKEQRKAKLVCIACPVRTECLAHALDHRIEFGVWGGMTERERRALLRARPQVRSWAELLLGARTAHYTTTGEVPQVSAPGNPDDRRKRHEDRGSGASH